MKLTTLPTADPYDNNLTYTMDALIRNPRCMNCSQYPSGINVAVDAHWHTRRFEIEIATRKRPGWENNVNLEWWSKREPGTGSVCYPESEEMKDNLLKTQTFNARRKMYEQYKAAAAGGNMIGLLYERNDQDDALDRQGSVLSSQGVRVSSSTPQ